MLWLMGALNGCGDNVGSSGSCNRLDAATDDDGDGFDRCYDCDDSDPLTFPGAIEVCDGLDNDCSGEADDPPFADLDGDLRTGCDDCNEFDPDSHKDASERCDGVDNDCDGEIDESIDAIDLMLYFPDDDGDGLGDAFDEGLATCLAPEGWVDNRDDCDDSDPTVGSQSCVLPVQDLLDVGTTWYGEQNEQAGRSLAIDEGASGLYVGAPGADRVYPIGSSAVPGAQYSLSAATGAYGTADSSFGSAMVASVDPVGRPFFAVGAPHFNYETRRDIGIVEVFGDLATAADASIVGIADDQWVGGALAASDLDGNGENELAITGIGTTGYAYGHLMIATWPLESSWNLNQVVNLADDYGAEGRIGIELRVAPAGDTTGDGSDNLLIGLPDAGRVALLTFIPGRVFIGDIEPTWMASDLDEPGEAICGGDLDDDGLADVVVGAPGADSSSAVVLFSPHDGLVNLEDAESLVLIGTDSNGRAGSSLATGDFDEDGRLDVAVGAEDTNGTGAVHIVTGPFADRGSLLLSDSSRVVTLEGLQDGAKTGATLAAGRLAGDSIDDLVVGSPGWDDYSGAVTLIDGGLLFTPDG